MIEQIRAVVPPDCPLPVEIHCEAGGGLQLQPDAGGRQQLAHVHQVQQAGQPLVGLTLVAPDELGCQV
ncbi:MAG: hypothetical protein HGA45_18970 [Chloroflexales bacterium]|nr:hypothetical protein [Chloroflexales bacterium]